MAKKVALSNASFLNLAGAELKRIAKKGQATRLSLREIVSELRAIEKLMQGFARILQRAIRLAHAVRVKPVERAWLARIMPRIVFVLKATPA